MTVYGFTASRHLDANGQRLIDNVLTHAHPAELWVTGACIGGDQYIATVGAEAGIPQRIYVPGDTSRVDLDWLRAISKNPKVDAITLPRGSTYQQRNQLIVRGQRIDVLVGFPQYTEDDPRNLRSGTWQTIRIARKAGIPLSVTVIGDGT